MHRLKFFIIFTFFSLLSMAQEDTDFFYIYESFNDSVDISNNFYDYSDSLLYIFNDTNYFASWDTTKIHNRKINWDDFEDIIKLPLFLNNTQKYVHPSNGKVTSGYGKRKRRFHYGIDIDLNSGDTVLNAFDGFVRYVGKDRYYGNVVVVRHFNGLETLYAHLSKTNKNVGDFIYAGECIGLGGNSGRSKGAHLHFEIRFRGVAINPQHIIDFENGRLISDTLTIYKKNFVFLPKSPQKTINVNNSKTPSSKIHVVKKGDTLFSIARRYNTTVEKICKLNNMKKTDILKEGKRLKIE